MPLNHPEYAHGISDADLIKEAIEFCNEELDGFNGMEYDSDSEVCCQRSNTFIRELVHRMFVAREAFRAGWKVNAVGTDVHSQEYLDGCEAVDWDEFIKASPGRAGAFYDAAALAAAEERGRIEERERLSTETDDVDTLVPSTNSACGEQVRDQWFVERNLPIMAVSGDTESDCVLKLHYRRPVSDDDRMALVEALNAYQAAIPRDGVNLCGALKVTLASLVATTSLIIRAEDMRVKPSKAVASDAMFVRMLKDYDAATIMARAVLASQVEAKP